jgi:hypothetical protein
MTRAILDFFMKIEFASAWTTFYRSIPGRITRGLTVMKIIRAGHGFLIRMVSTHMFKIPIVVTYTNHQAQRLCSAPDKPTQ